jgi:glyoxylase-like metal-dependent hydrolase (beta-lactamase superfamily II)
MRETFPDSSKFVLVEGDSEIVDGVKVLLTPGHTPGSQSIAVTTDRGTVVICGLCTIHENLFPSEEVSKLFPVIVPGIHTNVLQAYDSLMLIKRLADIAIPLHDATYSSKSHSMVTWPHPRRLVLVRLLPPVLRGLRKSQDGFSQGF